MFRNEAGAGHASPSSPDGGRRDRYHSSKRRRRIAPGPRRRRAQIRTQSLSEPRTSRSGTTYTPPDTVSLRPKPPAAAGKTLDACRSSRTTTTSPGDIAGSCTALAVALVSVTAFVPPVTNAVPRRTRRSPPRVLFLECAGICSCASLLHAPAPSPTTDAGRDRRPDRAFPLPPACAGCLPARPTIQARQHAPARLRRSNVRALRKHNPPLPPPALSFSLGPFRGPALRRSCSRHPSYGRPSQRTDLPPQPPFSPFCCLSEQRTRYQNVQFARFRGIFDAAGSDVDAAEPARRRDHHVRTISRRPVIQPPRYPRRRLHGSSLARSGATIPSSSANAAPSCRHDSRTACNRHTKTPADRPAQHRAALRFTLALASLDLGLCLGRPSPQTDGVIGGRRQHAAICRQLPAASGGAYGLSPMPQFGSAPPE